MFALMCVFGFSLANDAEAGTRTAREALNELQEGRRAYDKVQNRFFLKAGRFELSPLLGFVPNNPMVKRYTGGLMGAYHLTESFSIEGAFIYSPDLGTNDLKGLTNTLVVIATEGQASGAGFQQPVDKLVLGATFAARWAPIYGKINLIGERVLNFDFYGTAGLGLLSIEKFYARYSGDPLAPVTLAAHETKPVVPLNLGLGFDFFLTQSVALKIDARNYLYPDKKPQYDPDTPQTASRLYNNLVASVGVSMFFPKMQPRISDF